MIIQLKDLRKVIAVVIISFCAVFVTTLFSNFYLDLKMLDVNSLNIIQRKFYDTQLVVSKFVIIVTAVILSISAAIMLVFYIKQFIDESKHKIGILKALGYSNFFIAKKFSIFSFLVLIGSLAGFSSSFLLIPKFYESRNTGNLLSELAINFHPMLLLFLVVLPTLAFLVLSVAYVFFKLNISTSILLRRIEVNNEKFKPRKIKKNIDFLKELRSTILFGSKTLIFFVVFGAMAFSSMIQMSLGMRDFVDGTIRTMMLFIGIILSFSTLLISLEVVLNNNKKNISILRIMGYSANECTSIVLSSYRLVAYIGFLIGTVYQYFLITILLKILSKNLDNVVTYKFDFIVVLSSFILFVIIYEIFVTYYRRKIFSMDIKKIMLD